MSGESWPEGHRPCLSEATSNHKLYVNDRWQCSPGVAYANRKWCPTTGIDRYLYAVDCSSALWASHLRSVCTKLPQSTAESGVKVGLVDQGIVLTACCAPRGMFSRFSSHASYIKKPVL